MRSRQALSPETNRTYRESKAHPYAAVETAFVYRPTKNDWTYSHHAHLAFFGGRLVAIWSNGKTGEDEPGQRVLVSTSADFAHWTPPAILAAPPKKGKTEEILTAGGLYQYDGTLVAYYSRYDDRHQDTHLFATTSRDGVTWSAPKDLNLPIVPNHGPEATASGRLILSGNFAFPYTDDPTGLSGWTWSGFAPPEDADLPDNPATFWDVRTDLGLPAALCEGSFFQTDDGTLHMLLRATGADWGRLWETQSHDDGRTWSRPAETDFSDNDAKFHLGRLPNGDYYYVGNPDTHNHLKRTPLVVSLSNDGIAFDRHFVLGDTPYPMVRAGRAKSGQYGYPASIVQGRYLYVIASREKEAIEVFRTPLTTLPWSSRAAWPTRTLARGASGSIDLP